MKAVNVELVTPQSPQLSLGRGLPAGQCSNQSVADFDANGCSVSIAATGVFVFGANEAARVVANTSETNAVYSTFIDGDHFAYLGPASAPLDLDYRATSLAVHTQCSQIGKKCNLHTESGASMPFDCTDALYGNMAVPSINGQTEDSVTGGSILRQAGIIPYRDAGLTKLANESSDGSTYDTIPSNPHHMAVWARLSLESNADQQADGNVVTPEHGGSVWLLNCSTTTYTMTYDMINGTVHNAVAQVANGSLGTIINAPLYWGLGALPLESVAVAAGQYNDTARIAEAFAQGYSTTAMAMSSGIMTSRTNLEEQLRQPRLVSKVPKAPLYALVGLNSLYAFLGTVLAILALRSSPADTNEIRQKLTTAGIVAASFEPERAARPVEREREMFAEHEGVFAGKVGMDRSLGHGGYVLRLRQGLHKDVP
jgi:hypothetical protein